MRQWLIDTFLGYPICWLLRRVASLRYRVKVVGLHAKDLRQLRKEGGVLFLPNHPALIDPILVVSQLWIKWRVRPMIVEGVYFLPVLHAFFKHVLQAIKVPNFQYASNSYKLQRANSAVQDVVEGLKRGNNHAVWPAGRLRRAPQELVGGSSAVHEILKQVPHVPIVLIRTSGLWGSVFGWGINGKQPYLSDGFSFGFKEVLKNLIFFTPKREVVIELEVVSDRLPRNGSRQQLNAFLEAWYNQPTGPFDNQGEPIRLVSYSRWKPKFPVVTYKRPIQTGSIEEIPLAIRHQVIREVCRVSKRKPSDIRPDMHLFTDVGLDSLDIAELASCLGGERAFTTGVNYDMLTVSGLMALAADQFRVVDLDELPPMVQNWQDRTLRPDPQPPEGQTLHEAFLRCCDRMGDAILGADEVVGALTYAQAKLRVLLIAEAIRKLPGQRVGVMLPSSIAAQLLVLGILLAGKVPVMVNWTVGPRSLESMRVLTGVERVITSGQFLDRLEGADISPLHDHLELIEALRTRFRLSDKVQVKRRARLRADELLTVYSVDSDPDAHAVILFTTGTEAEPKAVPLTHGNILSNQRAAVPIVEFQRSDVLLSILPPFHSFGFTITGLIPVICGAKAFFFPNPTEAARIAIVVDRYRPTIICSTPSFLRPLFKAGTPQQLSSLRLFISGAESAPDELFNQIKSMNSEAVLIEGYGITECSPIITLNRPHKVRKGVGRPLDGVELVIVDIESGEAVPLGQVGRVLVRGPNIFHGYLGNTGSHPFVTFQGREWYNTGDLGSLDADGSLVLAGRLKRFVKVGGEMISLPALERAFEEIAAVRGWIPEGREGRLAVIEGPEVEGRVQLHLFATFFIDREEANEALRQAGFSNLCRLSGVHQLHQLPLLGSGKYDYRALAQQIRETEGSEA